MISQNQTSNESNYLTDRNQKRSSRMCTGFPTRWSVRLKPEWTFWRDECVKEHLRYILYLAVAAAAVRWWFFGGADPRHKKDAICKGPATVSHLTSSAAWTPLTQRAHTHTAPRADELCREMNISPFIWPLSDALITTLILTFILSSSLAPGPFSSVFCAEG
jgi:hypothetical protein